MTMTILSTKNYSFSLQMLCFVLSSIIEMMQTLTKNFRLYEGTRFVCTCQVSNTKCHGPVHVVYPVIQSPNTKPTAGSIVMSSSVDLSTFKYLDIYKVICATPGNPALFPRCRFFRSALEHPHLPTIPRELSLCGPCTPP